MQDTLAWGYCRRSEASTRSVLSPKQPMKWWVEDLLNREKWKEQIDCIEISMTESANIAESLKPA
jgi:hypothetical protein